MSYIRNRFFPVLIFVFSLAPPLLVPRHAFSQEDKSVFMELEGKPGVWVPESQIQNMLADIEELTIVRTQLKLMDTQLKIRADRIENFKLAIDLSIKAEKRAVEGLHLAIQAKERAEDKQGAWYRHPALWTVVGIVLTVAIEIVAVKTFQAVNK